ncbi:MAG TPA: hypothetical protein VNZ86_17540 [Bacteroidia bacterium]|nr:hypothetical protein [Bacteroidia bacterium]
MKQFLVRTFLFLFGSFFVMTFRGQTAPSIRVLFIYGSKPKKEFSATEGNWFGGILGGHVGIETDSNAILNFGPSGKFHLIARTRHRHSHFVLHSRDNFWNIFPHTEGPVKKLSIVIPVTVQQKRSIDSLQQLYLMQTPYDYALVGMRCAAAAYDVLGKSGVMPRYRKGKTVFKFRYPAKLRKRLVKTALQKGWKINREAGTVKRRWEKD